MGYRYIGSKNKILDEVTTEISRIVGKTACVADLMSGTASVSTALRLNGNTVIANDVMTYAFHHANVALSFEEYPSFSNISSFINLDNCDGNFERYEEVIDHLNNVKPIEGYFWNEFSLEGNPINSSKPRNYFEPQNAKKIDAVRLALKKMKTRGALNNLEFSLLMHDLIMATNDIANIAGTYGHYLSRTVGRAKQPLFLKPTILILKNDSGRHRVYQDFAENVASNISCDLCYIDPPYMKRQYAANYHILETIARGDEPEAIGESGLRPWRDQYSNFCTKTKIFNSFEKIITELNTPNYLISYSEDGLIPLDKLVSFFSRFGEVNVKTLKNKRFRSNDSRLKPWLTEYLIHLSTN